MGARAYPAIRCRATIVPSLLEAEFHAAVIRYGYRATLGLRGEAGHRRLPRSRTWEGNLPDNAGSKTGAAHKRASRSRLISFPNGL